MVSIFLIKDEQLIGFGSGCVRELDHRSQLRGDTILGLKLCLFNVLYSQYSSGVRKLLS